MSTGIIKRLMRSPLLICLIILLALWMLFFWRFLTTNPIDQLRFAQGDFTLHYYAFASYHVEQIQAGNWFPLWNPYNYGGDPFMGNVQWATWYPLRFVTAFLAGRGDLSVELYQFEIILHYLLASVMMLGFLKQLVSRWEAALLGALLYTYGGYLAGYPMLQPSVLFAVTWTPLILLGVHLSLMDKRWRWIGILVGSAGIALSFFGGHPQTTMQMIYFAGAYLLFIGFNQRLSLWEIIGRGVLLVGLGVGLAMVQLLPAIEFTALSARVQDLFYDAKSNGFSANEFFQVIYPFIISQWSPLYLGVAGLLLSLGTLLNYRKQYAFWLIVIVVGIFLSMGGNNIVYDLFYLVVPGFSTFRQQERIASLIAFALVVLATYRIDLFITRKSLATRHENRVISAYLVITCIIAFGVTLIAPFVSTDLIDLPLRNDVTLLALMQEISGLVALLGLMYGIWYIWQNKYEGARWHIALPILVLIILDLFTFNTRYSINFVPNESTYITQPPEYLDLLQKDVQDIMWRVDGSANLQGHGTYWRIPDMYGTGPFELGTTERLLHIGVDKRWELFAVRYVSQPEGSEPPENIAIDVVGHGINYSGGEYTLYELTDPRPMAHLVYDVRYPEQDISDPNTLRQTIRDMVNGPINLRETAVVGQPLPFMLSGERPTDGSVVDFQMISPERVTMQVSTPEKALLTIAIPNYPAWQVEVNGQPASIIEAYSGFISIPIEVGDNQTVTLAMRSQTYEVGRMISLISLFVSLMIFVMSLRSYRQPDQREERVLANGNA